MAAPPANVLNVHDQSRADTTRKMYLGNIRRYLHWVHQNNKEELNAPYREKETAWFLTVTYESLRPLGFPFLPTTPVSLFESYLLSLVKKDRTPLDHRL